MTGTARLHAARLQLVRSPTELVVMFLRQRGTAIAAGHLKTATGEQVSLRPACKHASYLCARTAEPLAHARTRCSPSPLSDAASAPRCIPADLPLGRHLMEVSAMAVRSAGM